MLRKTRKKILGALDSALPFALIAVAGLIGYLLFVPLHGDRERHGRQGGETPSGHAAKGTAPGRTSTTPPAVLPASPVPAPADVPTAPSSAYKARVAIIIDDIGSDRASIEGVLGLGAPVSVAVLPGMPYSEKSALTAAKAGRDVLLHLPMQPHGESMKGLGPGALMKGMDGLLLARTVEEGLNSVPGAVGVNNHMGSYLTEDPVSMAAVMGVLGRRRLFFVDSRTSAQSVALDEARKHHVRSAVRNVFLDDADDEAEIRRQFDRMVALALKNGEAVAIGHPRQATLRVLADELPGLSEKGIEVVRISKLAR